MATVLFTINIVAASASATITLFKNRVIFYPAAGADDGECESDGSSYGNGYTSTYLGYANSAHYYVFIRFANIAISKTATIHNAFLKLHNREVKTGDIVNVDLFFHNEADTAAPVNGSEVTGADLTSPAVAWNSVKGFDIYAGWYLSPSEISEDFAGILQDIIDLSGWVNGNAVVLQIRSNGSNDYRNFSMFDYSGGTAKPELHIDFTPPTRSFSADINAASATSIIFMAGGEVDASSSDIAGLDDSITSTGGTSNIDIEDIAGLDDSIIAQGPVPVEIVDGAGFNDFADAYFLKTISDMAGLDDRINGGLQTEHDLTDVAGLDDSIDVLNWSEFLRENQFNYVIRYFCTLTGAADDTSDIEIPIQQFQARKRDGESTYLSVNIPSFDYAGQIADRSNGQIIVEMAYFVGGVEQLREEILRVDLENIRIDQGSKNRSITLSGHRAESYGNQIATLTDPIYKYVSGGIRRYRFAIPDPYVNPGDTIRVGEDEFRAGYITYTVSNRYRSMEVTEAS